MRVLCKRLSRALSLTTNSHSSLFESGLRKVRTFATYRQWRPSIQSPGGASRSTLASPWAALQSRGVRCRASDLKQENYIQKKGSDKIYEVVQAEHTVQGRGGASIQVELRDVDCGNKSNEKLRTDETVEKVFVEGRSYTYLYTDGDDVVVMDPDTYEQLEVSRNLFGEAAVYLKDGMTVSVQLFDEKLMSASIPQRVTCKVVEAQTPLKGIAATPHYKKVKLDNGLFVQVPPYILAGDEVVINTPDNSFHSRA